MSHHRNCQHNGRKNSNSRHGDWICPFCSNYNYSFRVICNRCSAHPNSNPYMSNYFPYPCAQSIDKYPRKQDIKPTENKDDGFPKFLFLMLGDENLQWKQPQHSFAVENRGEQLANRWIQKLIQD